MMEIWKDIKGYEGYYKISNLGRIYILEKRFIDSMGRRRVLKAKYANRLRQETPMNLLG